MKSLRVLRVLAVVHAAVAFLQPVLAGSYLGGRPAANTVHETAGSMLPVIALLMIPAALLNWRRGKGRVWPLAAILALIAAEGAQIGLGYGRSLQIHIPLGVGIVAGSIAFAAWAVRAR